MMSLKKAFEEKGIATMLIDSKEYGEMDAATILKRAILAQKKNLMKIKLRG